MSKAALTWFEIPCTDIARAEQFYNNVLEIKLMDHNDDEPMRIFPAEEDACTGALVERSRMKPGMEGSLLYLLLNGDLDAAIGRVQPAGGAVIVPKMAVPGGRGHFCVVRDTEGNHVGVHRP